MKVRYHNEARDELTAAAEWYEARREGLGIEFVAEIKRAVASIEQRPLSWPVWQGLNVRVPVRKFVVERFPYVIPYLVREDVIVLLAVAHTRRRPGYWRARLR